jgi:REP element-mobilizing transposase RayT
LRLLALHTPIQAPGIYFVTFTCYRWLPLFELTQTYDAVYRFFSILNEKAHQTLGYTTMPNHVHLLLHFRGGVQTLNTMIGNGKRFIGYELVNQLRRIRREDLLSVLGGGIADAQRQRGHLHRLWQDSFDVKECRTEKFILQKLIYMHDNPCTMRWRLCKTAADYPHSSAAFYERGEQNPLLRDYRDYLPLLEGR